MAEANAADITNLPTLSRPATSTSQDNPAAIARAALMRHAHQIARRARPHMASYREALAYGLKAAWGMLATRREFAAVRARVKSVVHTAKQIEASRAATRRCGSSYMPF
jgi:hypothetical protein